MKSLPQSHCLGFTLVEALVTGAIMSMVLAAVTAGVLSLQRSFSASQDFITSHLEQVRAVDTLQRDARSATAAEVRGGGSCVVLTIPTNEPGLLLLQLPATLQGLLSLPGGSSAPTTKTVTYTFANKRLTRTENNLVQTVATRQTTFNVQQSGSHLSTVLSFPARYSNQPAEMPATTTNAIISTRTAIW